MKKVDIKKMRKVNAGMMAGAVGAGTVGGGSFEVRKGRMACVVAREVRLVVSAAK